jgi:NAD+ synthase (glutamine-hydrolysing)
MNFGFVRTAAVTPELVVADPAYNAAKIIEAMEEAALDGAKLIVFPELAVTGCTCGDLFTQTKLLDEAVEALLSILDASIGVDALVFVGLPWRVYGKLYNCMAVLNRGMLLGLVPKTAISDKGDFCESRYFTPGIRKVSDVELVYGEGDVENVPFGTDQLFSCNELRELLVGVEVGEDICSPYAPGVRHALAGATVIVNGCAGVEAVGAAERRRALVEVQSGRLNAAYIMAGSGIDESTTDMVFGAHCVISENGSVISESKRFSNGIIYGTIDVEKLSSERLRNTTFGPIENDDYERVDFSLDGIDEVQIPRLDPSPFVPSEDQDRSERCEEIFTIQAMGLRKRMKAAGSKKAVVGISGGLDSTLALLVTARAFDMLGLPREDIYAVTMPCFGTTDRTYNNACSMSRAVGARLLEVNIKASVRQHFVDIGHDEDDHNVTYENAQARERTQVLMDIANDVNGMVIGTGDLSELALGWATYNGDHMSMYGVNGDVPKTLVRHLVRYYADTCEDKALAGALYDVLDTPVSPELLPPKDGVIAQKTEDLVGPYELHDFFLYYMLRYSFAPGKIFALACRAFEGQYDEGTVLKWLRLFCRRFFTQQFKRSCLPDGPKVGSVGLSPRTGWRMPSDAAASAWLREVDENR